ncbi:hypothetical protein [Deinococcus humi]|uniref:Lipocalin-like domain-containing protein n=1 Tax=Deinococcus humi TaxID=662880 RepID=A0A7W8NFQ0_9DEIO|nr:hypothetical protein [Deinococcus humi]MBB5363960.1 hypothetical protein [Deinococcus humi]GGO32822.1 hypothetical protein GCM10008949_31030 [Deinococcus humi]
MKRILLLCTVPLFLAACGGPSTPTTDVNKQQTERLYGTWKFNYTIGGDSFSNVYALTNLNASKTPGEYYLAGTDEQNNVVVAGYDSKDKNFNLLDREAGFDRFFVFDMASETSAKGCYYQINMTNSTISDCYEMTGTRTSAGVALSIPKAATQERVMPSSAANGSAVLHKYLDLKTLAN